MSKREITAALAIGENGGIGWRHQRNINGHQWRSGSAAKLKMTLSAINEGGNGVMAALSISKKKTNGV
jgi:hypothetical protein